ncbi:hypothetical protein XI06_10980 [Bradyrhizobium sp. CCBAU 11434]|uniref:hypothetical protein n=1 Tax=Bradyrhizobium sp. CCBAU 11434 TaxID=1630885 RepID=UPI002305430C|nr:hypothetical protein [Bradyrhizobium sp. CCBAU 11434]MDA9520882.1 hypothetical protein [Bradyrhizobium sp. CCBAU 11434]
MGEDDKKTFPPKFTMMRNTRRLNRGEVASEFLEQWFAQAWRAHGPKALPPYIGHHDSYFKIELATGEKTNWDVLVARAKAGLAS